MRKDLVAFLVSQFSYPSCPFDGTAGGLLKFTRVEDPSDVGKENPTESVFATLWQIFEPARCVQRLNDGTRDRFRCRSSPFLPFRLRSRLSRYL